MRERLKKLLEECLYSPEKTCPRYSEESCDGCQYDSEFDECDRVGRFADFLLANGVTLPPVTVGQKVYQSDGVKVYESTVRKVIYETENVAFDEDAIGNSIFLSAAEAKGEKKLTYEEFLTDGKFVAGHRYSMEDLHAMYKALLDDDAEDRE